MARASASQLNKSSTMDLSTTVFLFLYDATFEKLTRVWLIELIRARLFFRFVANNNNNNNSTSLDSDLGSIRQHHQLCISSRERAMLGLGKGYYLFYSWFAAGRFLSL